MAEISHVMGGDLSLSPSGDLATVTGDQEATQRIIRRLATNAGDYIWQPLYGAGLPQLVGTPTQPTVIENRVRSQIFQEDAVAQTPAPTVATTQQPDGTTTVSIGYTDAVTGKGKALSFPVG